MRFVLEESSWSWDGQDREGFIERLEQLLDRTDVARERGEAFAASTELLRQQVHGHELSDLLFNTELPLSLPPEVGQRVAALLGSLTLWDEREQWPGLEVRIGGAEPVLSVSGAFAHARTEAGVATACLALPGKVSGPQEVVMDGLPVQVHFVVDEATHRAFFRHALEVERVDERGLEELAEHAFPDLYFCDGVWRGLGEMEGGYARVREALHQVLGVLDDHGAWVFTDESGRLSRNDPAPSDAERQPVTNQLVGRRFQQWGYEVAPEKPNVREDGACRRARERMLGRRTLYCEWHYKFERHTNRLHLHPPVPESGNRVVVAILHGHLPLPGDG